MTFKSYLEHSEPIFKDLNILDIFKINDYLTALFITKFMNNTRNASKLHKCYKRTNYVKHTLSNKGGGVWNSLETKLNEVNSYNTFKKKIKQHFLLYTITNI